ncbi:MAG TPA: DMT family transporter [bacterium]|nr:DMT family transporter [bacterium]
MKSQFRNRAEALIIGASFFFVSMAACVKGVSGRMPVYETVFFRAFVSAVALGGLMKARGTGFRAKNLTLMLTRSLSGFAAMSCNFYALGKLSFGDACTLVNTFPVFAALFSFLFLGERPTRALWVLIALSWAGILMILRPQFHFLNFAGFIALLAAIFSAVVIVVIHQTHETDPSLRIAFYFTALCAFIAFPLMMQDYVPPNAREWALLLGAGVLGTGGQILMTHAYGLADVSRLAPLSYVAVVLSFVAGMLFWGEIPSLWSVAGSAVVILGCVLIARLGKQPPTAVD